MSNIFGGNTGMSYEDVQRKRAIAQSLLQQNSRTPRNVGEGIGAIGRALAARAIEKRTDRSEKKLRSQFDEAFAGLGGQNQQIMDLYANPMATDAHKKVLGALLKKGVPGFSRGGIKQKKGLAVVGEAGPELVELPAGAKVDPMGERLFGEGYDAGYEAPGHNANGYMEPPEPDDYMRDEMGDEMFHMYENMNREQRLDFMNDPANGFVAPPPEDHRAIPQEDMLLGSFDDANSYRTADMSSISPSGVGETTQLNSAARSFQGFMKSLQDYEDRFADGGSTMWPGRRKDELAIAHRDLQMQMKELYNLGVLNGPDLSLMNEILINPTSIGGNVMDALGIADMEQRVPANIAQVRELMRNRTEPALQQLGIEADSLMPKKKDMSKMSDEELLKMLGGS